MNRRNRRTSLIVAGLASIALGGCGGATSTATHAQASTTSTPTALSATNPAESHHPPDTHHPAGPRHPAGRHRPSDHRSPALRHLQARLSTLSIAAGAHTGLVVVDLGSHNALFSVRPGDDRPPASVEKIYTTIALINLLGNHARFHTEVLGTGRLTPGGIWRGNLYLRGDGDPTFGDGAFNQVYERGQGPTAVQLVAQLRSDGITRVTGRIYGDESRFDIDRGGPATANQADVPDYGGELSALVYDHGSVSGKLTPATFAARQLALTLRSQKIRAFAATVAKRTPRGARRLAVVASPPLPTLLSLMDVPSDDLFADLFAKQLGYRFAHHGTLAAGAAEISRVIAGAYGIHARILDGSGLDKSDRSSPAGIVQLLTEIWHTAIGRELEESLPIVGETGTVQSLGAHSPAQGHCVAKTGTLNNVTNLAGYCAARGGRTLAFAIMIDGPPNGVALPLISRMVAAIAGF